MENLANMLIRLAKEESTDAMLLKEPLVWNSKRFEVTKYDEYVPTCDPGRFYAEGKGYLMTDGCSTEFYIDDRVRCAITYDRLAIMGEGHTVESFDDPLRLIRKVADQKFSEIWDDEEEMENIETVKKMAEIIGAKIEELNLLR